MVLVISTGNLMEIRIWFRKVVRRRSKGLLRSVEPGTGCINHLGDFSTEIFLGGVGCNLAALETSEIFLVEGGALP